MAIEFSEGKSQWGLGKLNKALGRWAELAQVWKKGVEVGRSELHVRMS